MNTPHGLPPVPGTNVNGCILHPDDNKHITRYNSTRNHCIRSQSYKKLMANIAHDLSTKGSTDEIFFPGDVVLYALEKQGIPLDLFDKKLGCSKNYFRDDIFNTGLNDGSQTLPEPFIQKMAALTGKDHHFWRKLNFTLEDADSIIIDMKHDITPVIEQFKKHRGKAQNLDGVSGKIGY